MDDLRRAKEDTEGTSSRPPLGGIQAAGPPTAVQLAEVERQMTGFEKATIRWTRTAGIMSCFAALFVCAQWWEMHEGGADTHNLAVAAANQAAWTQRLATVADTESGDMKELAEHTKTVADQALIQAQAARDSVKAFQAELSQARKETEVAQEAQRALVKVDVAINGDPHLDSDGSAHASFTFVPHNIGHSTALDVTVYAKLHAMLTESLTFEGLEERFCEDFRVPTGKPHDIFPGDSYSEQIDIAMASNEVKKASTPEAPQLFMQLSGCVQYRSGPSSRDLHQTPFDYVLADTINTSTGKVEIERKGIRLFNVTDTTSKSSKY